MKNEFVVLLVLIVISIAGCTAQQPADGQNQQNNQTTTGVKQFTIIISHTFYSPFTITVNRGDSVTIFAKSAPGTGLEGGNSHNHGMTIDEYSIDAAAPSENTPAVVNFVADKAGTFSIYCKPCWDGPFGRNHPDIRATLTVNP